jgi:hypothetical protein
VNLQFADDVDLRTAKALTTAYKGLGITSKDVGTYGKKQPDLKCKTFTPDVTAGGILSTTQAKDSLRPTTGAAAPAAGGARRLRRLLQLFA